MIDNKAPLDLIEKQRKEIIRVLRGDIGSILIFQCFITIPAIVFAPNILEWFQTRAMFATVFRYGLVAATLHVFMLFINILILYFNRPVLVARNYGIFFVLNGTFAYATTLMDDRYHGLGYAIAALITLVISVISFNAVLSDLNFSVFMRQPLGKVSRLPLGFDEISLR